tara:strand:- start:1125 stop:1400 length:276 start_codon:yes stop_codon:yes gene_type:complete
MIFKFYLKFYFRDLGFLIFNISLLRFYFNSNVTGLNLPGYFLSIFSRFGLCSGMMLRRQRVQPQRLDHPCNAFEMAWLSLAHRDALHNNPG